MSPSSNLRGTSRGLNRTKGLTLEFILSHGACPGLSLALLSLGPLSVEGTHTLAHIHSWEGCFSQTDSLYSPLFPEVGSREAPGSRWDLLHSDPSQGGKGHSGRAAQVRGVEAELPGACGLWRVLGGGQAAGWGLRGT